MRGLAFPQINYETSSSRQSNLVKSSYKKNTDVRCIP